MSPYQKAQVLGELELTFWILSSGPPSTVNLLLCCEQAKETQSPEKSLLVTNTPYAK